MNTILTDDERREIAKAADADSSGVASFEYRLIGLTEAAVLAKLREQEPVAWMREGWGPDCGPYFEIYRDDEMGWRDRKEWTPLYAAPLPAVVQVPQMTPDKAHEAAPKGYSYTEAGAWMVGWNACREAMLAAAPEAPAQAIPAPWRESLRETLMAARRWHQGDKWRDDSTSEQRAAWEEHAANLDAAITQLSDHTEQHLEMVPAPWREAVKVAREALQTAAKYTMWLDKPDMKTIRAAIARIDALEGGE